MLTSQKVKHGSYGQEKLGKVGKIRRSGKVGEFTFHSQGKVRVRQSQGKSKYQGAKVNKNAEKSFTQ